MPTTASSGSSEAISDVEDKDAIPVVNPDRYVVTVQTRGGLSSIPRICQAEPGAVLDAINRKAWRRIRVHASIPVFETQSGRMAYPNWLEATYTQGGIAVEPGEEAYLDQVNFFDTLLEVTVLPQALVTTFTPWRAQPIIQELRRKMTVRLNPAAGVVLLQP